MENSIHQQQLEDMREDLQGASAIQRIKDVVAKAATCFFRTSVAKGPTSGVRPMNVQKVDDEGNLWFLSSIDSNTNSEIQSDPAVELFFQGTKYSDFLHLVGTATISRDKAMIHELWDPMIKTWFTEGVDDPRITVIRVTPADGYYWDNKHGNLVAGMKMMVGAMIGKTLDDSIEGTIRV